jgi:hypothetical protein
MPVTVTPEGIKVEYTEPTTNKNDSPLTDLAKTTIYYDIGAGLVKAMDVPATSPSGGGAISQVITVPILPESETDVKVCISATDLSNQESDKSANLTVRYDTLPPAAPVLSK